MIDEIEEAVRIRYGKILELRSFVVSWPKVRHGTGDNRPDGGFLPQIQRFFKGIIGDYQNRRSRIVQLALQLRLGVKRVVHHGHGADAQDRLACNDDLGCVGHQYRYLLTFADAQIQERTGKSID